MKTVNLQQPPTSLKQLNAFIQQTYPKVIVVKGEGYFYVASDDEATSLHLAGLFSSSIYAYSLKHQSLEKWLQDVTAIMQQAD